MRLIDADAFFKDFPETRDYEFASQEYEVDAVPVVRCRDCMHRRENTTRNKKTLPYYCEIHAEKFCDLEEFCCYGNREGQT